MFNKIANKSPALFIFDDVEKKFGNAPENFPIVNVCMDFYTKLIKDELKRNWKRW